MSRYIDADALIDRLDFCVKEGMGSKIAYTFKHIVDEAPTIDIVRCKECKWCVEDDYIVKCWNIKGLNKTDGVVNLDDFCSYGCRKEE